MKLESVGEPMTTVPRNKTPFVPRPFPGEEFCPIPSQNSGVICSEPTVNIHPDLGMMVCVYHLTGIDHYPPRNHYPKKQEA